MAFCHLHPLYYNTFVNICQYMIEILTNAHFLIIICTEPIKRGKEMIVNERHNEILSLIKARRNVSVSELAALLFVSEATVRRDLVQMQRLGLIERTRGGAVASANAEESSHFVRIVKNAKEKERIASCALSLLPTYHSVFIDGSSTALALAERMNLEHRTVITYNLQTALQLSKKPNVNLIVLGGSVHYNTASATGAWTAKQVNEFRFDLLISSCSAIVKGEVLENSADQKELKQNAIAKSAFRILLADHTKFERSAIHRTSLLSDYDLVVTDATIPYELPNLHIAK